MSRLSFKFIIPNWGSKIIAVDNGSDFFSKTEKGDTITYAFESSDIGPIRQFSHIPQSMRIEVVSENIAKFYDLNFLENDYSGSGEDRELAGTYYSAKLTEANGPIKPSGKSIKFLMIND